MTRTKISGGWGFVLGLTCGVALWIGREAAQAQQATEALKDAKAQRAAVEKMLRDFVQAAQNNDVEAALKLFPSEEDLKPLLPADQARRSAAELRSAIKLNFQEFVEAIKAFGKNDLVEIEPGTVRRIRKGEGGLLADTFTAERGYISFARDGNYFIELRFNVGGILRVRPDRWVITNLITREEQFATIKVQSGGG